MPREIRRLVRSVLAIIMVLTLAGPMLETSAATDLYPGAPAVVASLTGLSAPLRIEPSAESPMILQIDNGLAIDIIDGPIADSIGSFWYQVNIAGSIGYLAADDLTWGTIEEPEPAPISPDPLPAVTGTGMVFAKDETEIICRIAPYPEAEQLFVYANGSSVDLAGTPIDEWQPVLCAAQLGYLPVALVHEPGWSPAPEPTEIPIDIEETTEVIDDVASEAPSDEVLAETEPGDLIEDTQVDEPVDIEDAVPSEPIDSEITAEEPVETEVPAIDESEPTDIGTPSATIEADEEETSTPITDADEATPELTETEIPEVIEPVEIVGQTVPGDDQVFAAASTSAGVVYNTGAGGLRCRVGASLDSQILLVLPLGASVPLVGIANDGWQAVICDGQRGFVASRFLQSTDSGSSTGGSSGGSTGAITGTTGIVQDTGGAGLRCRSGASLTASIITVLAEGTVVTSRGNVVGDWQPVTCAGSAGWVHIDFIGNSVAGSTGGTDGGTGGPSTGSTTGSAVVANTGGDGVRFRASASLDAAVIAVLMEGASVTLRNGSTGDWTAVTWNGRNGFIHSDYLGTAKNPSPPSSGSGSGVGSTGLGSGNNARVTESLNFRSGASYSADVIGVAAVGTVVRITGNVSNGFYPVKWAELAGYMHGDYLVYTTAALSTTGPNGATTDNTGGGPGAGSGPGSAIGQQMVDYAMHYLGYPYIWATHGPDSFDCSGFTYWVVLNTTGRDIGAGTWTQWGVGAPIQYGSLQPGDLVFFQNTYTVGLSHVGMYIGNDQFIHAENEDTGVRISSLSSNYYATRYLGARRLG